MKMRAKYGKYERAQKVFLLVVVVVLLSMSVAPQVYARPRPDQIRGQYITCVWVKIRAVDGSGRSQKELRNTYEERLWSADYWWTQKGVPYDMYVERGNLYREFLTVSAFLTWWHNVANRRQQTDHIYFVDGEFHTDRVRWGYTKGSVLDRDFTGMVLLRYYDFNSGIVRNLPADWCYNILKRVLGQGIGMKYCWWGWFWGRAVECLMEEPLNPATCRELCFLCENAFNRIKREQGW